MTPKKELRDSFDIFSKEYDEARLEYPEELVDDALKISGIPKDGKILDVGCGPGKATIQFGRRGYDILGLDIGSKLIGVARQKSADFRNIDYKVGVFETTYLPLKEFDLIISAQSWHWLNPYLSNRKANRILNDGGYLALFWNFEAFESSEFMSNLKKLFKQYCPDFPKDYGDANKATEHPTLKKYFKPVKEKIYSRDFDFNTEGIGGLIDSYS